MTDTFDADLDQLRTQAGIILGALHLMQGYDRSEIVQRLAALELVESCETLCATTARHP